MGSIAKKIRGFYVTDPKKILLYWASIHKMEKIYEKQNINSLVKDFEKVKNYLKINKFTIQLNTFLYFHYNLHITFK